MRIFRRAVTAAAAVLVIVSVAVPVSFSWFGARAQADETTVSADTVRDGWDQNEPGLSPSQVTSSSFGQLWSTAVNGQVYAQPIVVGGNVIVATENNDVYSLNAVTGTVNWSLSLGPAWPASALGCGDLTPNVGITSTPVYDPSTGTIYLTAKTNDGADTAHPHWYLHALNASTGAELSGWPVTIQGAAPNNPAMPFDPLHQMQRPGLLLMGGSVYAAFGSHCDYGTYAGWVAGVNTATKALSLWNDESGPNAHGAGIWQSGGGLMSDGAGRIFLATGNGVDPPVGAGNSNPPTFGESVVRLAVAADGSLSAADFFSPANANVLDTNDQDFGSGAPVALPSSFGTPTYPHLLVNVGKDGRVFLLNRDNLGGRGQVSGGGDNVLGVTGPIEGVWGHPAVWGGDGGYVYLIGSGGPLRALKIGATAAGVPALSLAGNSAGSFGYTSGSPVVTSSGTTSGSALVWSISASGPSGGSGQLVAYSAVPVNGTLHLVRSFPIGTASKFATPATDGGRVFVGTRDGHVIAFGQPVGAALTAPPVSFGSVNVGATASANVTLTATKTVTVSAASATAPFSAAPTGLPVTLTAGQTLAVPVTFAPTAAGSVTSPLTLTTDSGNVAVDLNGTGVVPGFTAASALAFGTVAVGLTKTLTVSFTNSGTTAETVSAVTAPNAPFTASSLPAAGTSVAPGVSIAVPITYTPTTPGNDTGTITVAGPDGTATVTLTGTAVTGTATLAITPAALSFGSVQVGQTASLTFTIANTGNLPLTITKAAPPTAPFNVATPVPEGLSLSPGTSLTTTVTFTPTAAGAVSGSYLISSDTGQGAMTLPVTGTGVNGVTVPPPPVGWTLNGTAAMSGTDLNLTQATQFAAGSAVYPTAVPSNGLHATFTAQIGGGTGSCGITFAMLDPSKSTAQSLGANGGGMGFSGLTGVAVTLDTFQPPNVASNNFIGVSAGGSGSALTYIATATNVPALRTGSHVIDVLVSSGVLTVSVDGTQVIKTSVTLPANVFPAFTGSTGYHTDVHTVRNVTITSGPVVAPPPPPTSGSIPAPGSTGWSYNGSAVMSGTDLVLTPAATFKAGTAFNSTVIPTTHLHATFTAQIGGGTGSTGECFAVLDAAKANPTMVGVTGGGLGFSGLPGVAVCLQTHQNTGDPSANFVGISNAGKADLLTYLVTSTAIGPLRTGTHLVDVQVGSTGNLLVSVDGTQVLNYAVGLPATAIVGFTGATGGGTDVHTVRAVTITY
jgi:hypothetical protein